MTESMFQSLSLVDVSGYVIITAIIALLIAGAVLTFWLFGRYAMLDGELTRLAESQRPRHPVLARIASDVVAAQQGTTVEINTQAIVEQNFHTQLEKWLLAERFLRVNIGLMIILGLVGTFYGLTLSIGKLVTLVSGDLGSAAQLTESLTRGLTEALAGMSVAFSTSLFGIVAAILMTLLGVFFDVPSRRTATMVRIEAYVDNVLLKALRAEESPTVQLGSPMAAAGPLSDAGLSQATQSLGQTVAHLHGAVDRFDAALVRFADNTRDFQEFNLHLKDNIQRMSLSFGDLSDALQQGRRGGLRDRS